MNLMGFERIAYIFDIRVSAFRIIDRDCFHYWGEILLDFLGLLNAIGAEIDFPGGFDLKWRKDVFNRYENAKITKLKLVGNILTFGGLCPLLQLPGLAAVSSVIFNGYAMKFPGFWKPE